SDVTSPRSTPLATEDVTFSEPIDLATFDYRDLMLTDDGATVPLTSAVTAAPVAGTTATYRISGLGAFTSATGAYELTVDATGVRDPAGNGGTDQLAVDWATNSSLPPAPTNLAITPDTGRSASDGATNTGAVTLSGALGAPGLSVDVFDSSI